MRDLEIAKQIIQNNWRDGFTIPTSKLYPFQWMWDSGFVALGTSTYDINMSLREIENMFSGQWENGMLPHILFHSEKEKTYFPNYDFWNSNINEGAPNFPKSSGITQPAVFGFILNDILKNHWGNEDVKAFVKKIFPKLVKYHRFLYKYRDPNQEGLFFIFHPWESGRDNSPLWDDAMDKIKIHPGSIPNYQRRDTSIADADERPTKEQYDRYVYLLELGKKYKYDGKQIAEESPFLIQDNMMNAILIKSNNSLIEMADDLKLDSNEVKEWQQLSMSNYDRKFWNEDLETYVGFDLRHNKQLLHREIGGLIPLFADIPDQAKAEKMNNYLQNLSDRGYYLCPSFDVDSPKFDSKRYWRGPIWPQMNWMVHKGLRQYGFNDTADKVKSDLNELIHKLGFFEYFEAQKIIVEKMHRGYGGDNFSWTASSYIHLNTVE
ncbi:MAG: glycoside hydrolase [Bacteroidia bacterium]|nr:glycoside hydrolase [Bacteroidia bacterium]